MKAQITQKTKSDAQAFLEKEAISVPQVEALSFKNELKEKVLSQYINFNENKKMEKENKPLFRRPKFLGAFGLIMAAFIAVPVALYFTTDIFSNEKNSKNNLGAELAYAEGAVEYNSGNNWETASKNIELHEGDSLRALADGKAIINLDDGSAIRLNNDSSVTLASMDPENVIVSNDHGEIYTRVSKAEREFTITTDDVSYKSLGTAYLTVNEDSKKGVEVYHSKVEARQGNSNNKYIVDEGNKYYFVNEEDSGSENKLAKISPEDITGNEFIMWNKAQDKLSNEFKEQLGILTDTDGPEITITSPGNNSSTQAEKVTVQGTTEAGAEVKINGTQVENKDGKFSYEISLNIGENKIEVIAKDTSGNKTVKSIKVTRQSAESPSTGNNNGSTQPKPDPGSTVTPQGSISASGQATSTGIKITWSISNMDASKGFKIVRSTSQNPVYPGNEYKYLSDPGTRSYHWEMQDGKTYHFRVCQYLGSSCGIYSNNITVTAPTKPDPVTSITVSDNGNGTVSWTVAGYSAKGFKVVWGKASAPTYPTRASDQYQYFSDPSARSSNALSAFDGAGTYYVRVCEYLGGTCGLYSNEITVNL